MIGLLGKKLGMTRVFTDSGVSIPVSVVEIEPNRVAQIKEVNDEFSVQVVGGRKKTNRVNKPLAGHFSKAEVEAGDMIREFRVDSVEDFKVGQVINIADVFKDGDYVDVSGVSKGKGFAGAVKRHNFRTQDATHGNSLSHRAPGSIGQNQTPGRVFKGKKMAGHLGNKRVTVQSLELVKVDAERNLLLVKGAIPGAPGGHVKITPAIKMKQRGK